MTAETLHTGPLQRGLKNRHIQLIALGGAIGTGFRPAATRRSGVKAFGSSTCPSVSTFRAGR